MTTFTRTESVPLSPVTSLDWHEPVTPDVSCEEKVKGCRVVILILTKYSDKGETTAKPLTNI